MSISKKKKTKPEEINCPTIFMFENKTLTINTFDLGLKSLDGKHLRENYIGLLMIRNYFDIQDEQIIKYIVTSLYKTRSIEKFLLYLEKKYKLITEPELYRILYNDRDAGIITKKMMED